MIVTAERPLDYYAKVWRDADGPGAEFVKIVLNKDGKIDRVEIRVTLR